MRIPGLRLLHTRCEIEESRMWREPGESKHSILWHGTSRISFDGIEVFEIHDFPFDRQIINLDHFNFVWRVGGDSVHGETMKIVSLVVETYSMLPEWEVGNAILIARHQADGVSASVDQNHGQGPSFCCKFSLKLRLQRKPNFYIQQVFLVSTLITSAACLPFSFNPVLATDRCAMHLGGLLTLVAFKYSVTSELPVVPYATFTSTFLTNQIWTIVLVIGENVLSYKFVISWKIIPGDVMERMEGYLLVLVLVCWCTYLSYAAFKKTFKSWREVLNRQTTYDESHMPQVRHSSTTGGLIDAVRGKIGSRKLRNADL